MSEQPKRTELCLIAAQEALAAFDRKHGPLRLPVPVEELAASLGFQVVGLSNIPDEFSGIVSIRDRLIGINARHHRHRRRFSICHELAHILLNHPPESQCSLAEIALYNAEADECASELLMPTQLLSFYMQRSRITTELARIFDVSEEAMARKLRTLDPPGNAVMEALASYTTN
jgi:Zn-dependent peptidase ImmA (M78 family)